VSVAPGLKLEGGEFEVFRTQEWDRAPVLFSAPDTRHLTPALNIVCAGPLYRPAVLRMGRREPASAFHSI
jgi:hypothetical protein